MKKIIWITAIFLCFGTLCLARMRVQAATEIEHGYANTVESVRYTLDSDGLLHYTGMSDVKVLTRDLYPISLSDPDLVKEILVEKVDYIEEEAFRGYKNLEKITIRGGSNLYDYAMADCPKLKYLDMEIGYIGVNALYNSPNVEEVRLPWIIWIMENGLAGSGDSIRHMSVGDGFSPSRIAKNGLGTLSKLETLDLASVEGWINGFNMNMSDTDPLKKAIDRGIAITIEGEPPTLVKEIWVRNISNGKLYGNRFSLFPNLESVHLDESVKSLGEDCFAGCEKLKTVYVPDLENWLNMTFSGFDNDNPLMTSPDAKLVVEDMDFNEVEIPEGVTRIPAGTFRNQKSLTTVILPETLEAIGADAFLGCDNLQKVYIKDPDSWDQVTFENSAANPMSNASAVLVSNEEYVHSPGRIDGTSLYWDLTADGTLILSGSSDQVKSYKKSPFTKIQVKKVVVSNSAAIKKIPAGLFAGCTGITEVELSPSVATVGANAFAGCSKLQKVCYTDALTTIESGAFANCTSLYQFTNLDNTFLDEAGIAEEFDGVELSENLTSVGTDAFKNCTAITSVILFRSLHNLAETAFAGCGEIEWSEPPDPGEASVISVTQNFNATVVSSVTFNNKKSKTIRLKNITNTGGRAVRITAVAAAQTGYVHCRASGKNVKITPYGKKGSTNLILTVKCGTYSKYLMVRVIVNSSVQETVKLQNIAAAAVTLYTTEPAKYISVSGVKTSLKILDTGRTENGRTEYYSADQRIAKTEIVKGRLMITPVKAGKTEVYAYAVEKDGYTVSNVIRIPITVKTGPKVRKITISGKKSVKAGKAITLTAKVTVAAHGNKKLSWTVSNKKYAKLTVLKGGRKVKIKGLKAGRGKTVTITAKAKDGSKKKAAYKVRIKR